MSAKKRTPQSGDVDQSHPPNRATDVKMDVSVEFGRVRLPLERLLSLVEGSLLKLHAGARDPVDVRVEGRPFAKGEVISIGENFGVRVTELLNP